MIPGAIVDYFVSLTECDPELKTVVVIEGIASTKQRRKRRERRERIGAEKNKEVRKAN